MLALIVAFDSTIT